MPRIVPFPGQKVKSRRSYQSECKRQWAKQLMRQLRGSRAQVWLALGIFFSRKQTGHSEAFPSIQTIADYTGLSRAQILRALAFFRQVGLISTRKTASSSIHRFLGHGPDPRKAWAAFFSEPDQR